MATPDPVSGEMFVREGLTKQLKYYLNPFAGTAVLQAASVANALVTAQQQGTLKDLLSGAIFDEVEGVIPGKALLDSLIAANPTVFTGSTALANLLTYFDPSSATYIASTNSLYDNSFITARAFANSGPINVRGGMAQNALELAELSTLQSIHRFKEIWENSFKAAEILLKTVQEYAAIETTRRADQIKSTELEAGMVTGYTGRMVEAASVVVNEHAAQTRIAAAYAELFGQPVFESDESVQGQGTQGPITTGFGMSVWR